MCEVIRVAAPWSCILERVDFGLSRKGVERILCRIDGDDIVLGFPGPLRRGCSHC